MKKPEQRYVIRKYVTATSAQSAIMREKKVPVHDVWVDEDWKKSHGEQLTSCIGFTAPTEEDYED